MAKCAKCADSGIVARWEPVVIAQPDGSIGVEQRLMLDACTCPEGVKIKRHHQELQEGNDG